MLQTSSPPVDYILLDGNIVLLIVVMIASYMPNILKKMHHTRTYFLIDSFYRVAREFIRAEPSFTFELD